MGSRRSVLGGAAVLIWVGTLVLHTATGIGWWAAVPALAAAVLAALALAAPPRPQAWGAGPGRRRRASLPKGPVPAGRAFSAHAGPAPGLWEARPPGSAPVFRSDVSASSLAWADDDAVAVGSGSGARHRPLLEYADDPLTPVAAETLADGLERLLLRLGPPPGAAGSPDQTAPHAPR
ncbi:hypothetical protein [Kitasatospora sp. NPDC005856]|uniref:hypothetical protein n=1 Tax=Kitasatospora sp. NPDC005856 TaxID=3154566 RepID=UPI0034009D26